MQPAAEQRMGQQQVNQKYYLDKLEMFIVRLLAAAVYLLAGFIVIRELQLLLGSPYTKKKHKKVKYFT